MFENILENITNIYNNFMNWYTDLWVNAVGEIGMTIVSGFSVLAFIALVGMAFKNFVKR